MFLICVCVLINQYLIKVFFVAVFQYLNVEVRLCSIQFVDR